MNGSRTSGGRGKRRGLCGMPEPRRATSSQDFRNRKPASCHHAKAGDLLLQAPFQAKPARVLPQYDERSLSTSLDSQPMHGGADATGQSAIANDATAPIHRRRNPSESLRGGSTLPEPAIPPVALGHARESIRRGPAAIRVCNWTPEVATAQATGPVRDPMARWRGRLPARQKPRRVRFGVRGTFRIYREARDRSRR